MYVRINIHGNTDPKLEVVKELMKSHCKTRCIDVGSNRIRRMLTKLKGGGGRGGGVGLLNRAIPC